MLERLAAWFLNTYVADYVGNVDTDQLSIGLLKGAVELEKLPLKKDALRKLKLPFDIKSGYIGKLKLQIPVRYIKSQPWVIQIDQLYVVAGPARPQGYNAEEEETARQIKKQAKLDKLEERWKAEQNKSSSWWGWSPISGTFASNIVANLQVVVNDVHIRYEDPEADTAHPFAIGLLLENLSAQSTDRYWETKFTSGEDMAWKLMDLQNFALYFDHELLGGLEGQSLTEAILKKRSAVLTQQDPMTASSLLGVQPSIECVIKPISGQAKLTRNCSEAPLRISDGPRLQLEIQVEEIPISLSDKQYHLLMNLLSAFKMRMKANRFRRWRPNVNTVLGHERKWWRFALDATLSRIRRRNQRSSLQFALQRAHQNVLYVRGYTQHLTEVNPPEEVRQKLKEVEKELSFEELAVLRTLVMNRIKKERDLVEAAKRMISSSSVDKGGGLKSWFPGWISRGEPTVQPPGSETQPPSTSGEGQLSEEDQLLNEIGYEAKDNILLRDRIFLTLNVSLAGGSFQLVTTPTNMADSFYGPEPLVEMTFKSLCFSADLRPRLKYGSFDLSLGSVMVKDHSHPDTIFPVLVQPKDTKDHEEIEDYLNMMANESRSQSLFGLKVVAEEVNHQMLYQLKVHSKPLEIVYNAATLTCVKDFFTAPLTAQESISHFQGQIQDYSLAHTTLSDRLGGMLGGGAKTTSHRITSIKLDISAPHLILPEDFTDRNTSMVILDLGHVTFGNVLEWSCDSVGVDLEPGLDDDDDDEFQTPPSSPPSEEEMESTDGDKKATPIEPEDLQAALHSVSVLKQLKLPHERYLLRLSDLQILVGRREGEEGEGEWRAASLSGNSGSQLLEKFTLSVKIQRTLKLTSENEAATLNLAADLPSLRFHIDEEKVHALILCLQAIKIHSKSSIKPPVPHTSSLPDKKLPAVQEDSFIATSMYHSAVDSLFGKNTEGGGGAGGVDPSLLDEKLQGGSEGGGRKGRGSIPDLAERLLIASEKQISAKLSVTEILLSLSSRGRVITELNVPGINLDFLKRPHDLALRLLVQDLCLVDRIQTFGPEYELVVCSSGRSLLGFSPPVPTPSPTPPKSYSSPSVTNQKSSGLKHLFDPMPSGKNSSSGNLSTVDLFDQIEPAGSGSLLTLCYSFIQPHSPHHPAVVGAGQGAGQGEGVEGDAVIHRVNVQCTAVDAIANQETIIELVGFFRRALTSNLLPQLGGQIRHLDLKPLRHSKKKKKKAPLEAEMSISFERLGVRMLRREEPVHHSSSFPSKTPPRAQAGSSGSFLIASFMLYGLSAEGKISTSISIQGRMEGIHVRDLTPVGKKYPDILSIGVRGGEEMEARQEAEMLSFSINRSPQGSVSLSGGASHAKHSDVHLFVHVPAIHYLHSVNFVYEMEMFISDFLKYITSAIASTVKNAAVGVAKGLVRRESQLVRSMSMLHTSFGHANSKTGPNTDDAVGGVVEETDSALPFQFGSNKLYYDISVQSPVIVLPGSLSREDCLVAHLGEITVKNEYLSRNSPHNTMHASGGFETPGPLSSEETQANVERMTLTVSNISLHASHTAENRLKLTELRPGQPCPEKCSRVLREVSAVLQIDKHLTTKPPAKGHQESGNDTTTFDPTHSDDADLVITGRVCDPLLIELPKGIFDQLKTTLKHGIRRKPRQKRHQASKIAPQTSKAESDSSKSTGRSVQFDPVVEVRAGAKRKRFPTIFASFSLPKLSLELKHVIDSQDRSLVYVSLDDLSVQYHQSNINFLSVDLALKSIVIEDLLQAEDSEYRNILASSSRPLPFPLSPVAPSSKVLRNIVNLSNLSGLGLPMPQPFFPLSHLMSTPKPPQSGMGESPLRSFVPSSEKKNLFGSSSERKNSSSSAQDETGSTIKDEKSTFSELHKDLLTVRAFYVDKKHPQFKEKYDSICLHGNVDFSSVFVIINLQTWVLLLDYIGIGIPTPPPSRPGTPDGEGTSRPPPTDRSSRNSSVPREEKVRTSDTKGTTFSSDEQSRRLQIDSSLLADAKAMLSLGSPLEDSLYMSTYQAMEPAPTTVPPGRRGEGGVISDLSGMQEAYSAASASSLNAVGLGKDQGSSVWGVEGKMSVQLKLNVNSLTVTFNKPEHPLARGGVSGVTAEVKLVRGNMEISGSLGQGSVLDMTETGAYYRERFTTTGDRALMFEIFKYGRPDPLMERPFDILVKVQMASVRYLHTMRFLKEILAFISHFPQLIDAFQRMKAIAQGNLVYNGPERKARMSFDVNIAGPILLIPKHAFSPFLMVGDIGHLTVTNSIRYDGEEGTISHTRLRRGDTSTSGSTTTPGESSTSAASNASTKLSPQASIFSLSASDSASAGWSHATSLQGVKGSSQSHSENSIFGGGGGRGSVESVVEEDRKRVERLLEIFRGPCLLDCIEVDLTEVDVFSARRVPAQGESFKIEREKGNVLKEKGAARLYIQRNLYEDFCRDVPDLHIEGTLQAIHVMLDKPQLELIKGLVEMNLGETIQEFEKPSTIIRDPIAQPMAADVWTGLLFRMQFVEVQMEFLRSRQTDVQGSVTQSLARFDIQESEFTFESQSNQCKTVDLTSNAVIGYDTRYESYSDQDKPSVFEEVLRPRFDCKSEKKTLQVELHFFISPTVIKASILLNKLRLVGIFDLILELKSFVFDKIEEEIHEAVEEDELDAPGTRPLNRMPEVVWSLRKQLASRLHLKEPEDKPPRRVSLKLSMTETDFIVLEDMTSLDSNAVVLKGTLILKFLSIPDREKLLNCSIDGLELFSCSLSNEDETALSILDPVTISLEIKPPEAPSGPGRKKSDKMEGGVLPQILEIEVQQLNFRLSYNDIKLFLGIAQSLPSLTDRHTHRETTVGTKEKEVNELLVKQLVPLGFTRSDIRKVSENNQDTVALLTQQSEEGRAGSVSSCEETEEGGGGMEAEKKKEGGKVFAIESVQVNVGAVSVCLIDDCVDHDVPLLDFSLADIQAEHNFLLVKKGRARAMFAGDYYNRHISAWEPVLEPWMCELSWKTVNKFSTDLDSSDSLDRTCFALTSKEQLNLNVTSSLIHILRITQASWSRDLQQNRHVPPRSASSSLVSPSSSPAPLTHSTADILKTHRRTASGKMLFEETDAGEEKTGVSTMEKGLALLHSVRFVSETRQRTRFVPFLLRNNTGLPLKFATLTSVPSKVYVSPFALYQKTKTGMGGGGGVVGRASEWMDVSSGSEQPFDFSSKGKMRHRDTRDLIVHQLLVKVAGWQSIDIPVSVDKIGIFFREVWPSSDTDLDLLSELPVNRGPVRLVFAISLSDVQKVVNVRSALVLSNTMEIPLEVKLEPNSDHRTNSKFGTKSVNLPILSAKGYLAVPIHLTSWNVFVRPQHWGVQYCSKHLAWRHVTGATPTNHTRSCDAVGEDTEGELPLFRFCVSVQRDNFPPPVSTDPSPTSSPSSSLSTSSSYHPAHTLTLLPPFTVANLLPCDLQFSIMDPRTNLGELRQRRLVPKGKEVAVYSVDCLSPVEFDVALEGFENCQGCVVSPDQVGVPQSMVLEDYQGRPLRLTVTTYMAGGSAIKVRVSSSFWLVNRTGLPLVFRQEGMSTEAAGQQEEHEKASTTTPLLFSYSEGEFVEKCSMRLGREYRYLSGRPLWCSPFRMISDCGVCRVFVRSKDDRPDQEFQVGVDIRRGTGKYRFTKIVTFVAHYQLINRTSYKLAYLQRHQLVEEDKLYMSRKVPTIMPGALLPFHWPRTDLDQLLCVRVVDIADSMWSGGFMLDKDSSFHINIRSAYSYSAFIRCQVTLRGATYHVIFSDAASYPPPFRLENLSQTSLSCCQEGVKSSLSIPLNPGQSVPYSWDEHTLPERLSVMVKGGSELVVDLDKFGSKGKVYYESYFYIVAYSTFPAQDHTSFHSYPTLSSTHQRRTGSSELVLDVPQGTAVIFQKKDPERRTQLWRMSASRQLVHIASSSSSSGTSYVLDIAGGRLPVQGHFEPLILRRSSTSRVQSQTWKFSEHGRLLMDQASHLCVQSRSGYETLREGADAVLGHVMGGRGFVPREQEVRRMKHSPGSGVLSVSLVPDGPTRMLRVVDENRKYSHTSPRDDWVVVENGQVAPLKSSDVDNCLEASWDSEEGLDTPTMELEVALVLEEGVGMSLINAVPEELIYASFRGIKVEFVSCKDRQSLNANVQYIQVDNKLAACHTPILAYPTPSLSREAEPSYPILILHVEKIPYKSPYALVFKVAEMKMQDMTINLEEKLLFKLLQWAGVGCPSQFKQPSKEDEILSLLSYRTAKSSSGQHTDSQQLYCELLDIATTVLRISVSTTSQLPDDLKAIKYRVGFPLIKFQSPVKLRGYQKSHILGEATVYADSLMKHYKRVIKAQAINILGSVDFLGNPMGLVSDVASGVSGMISIQPDVVGLVRDVAHGMSDTTSKLTGTVSHVLGKATFDSSYQEEREQMLESCQTSGDHLKAGLMGLSSGVFGGMTSIVTQPIKDARSYGVGGFFTGLAKGVVGTVAKPVAGLFDLASETSAAIRETTSRVSRQLPSPVRLTRCCLGANGALTPFSVSQARGREYLLRLTDGKLTEKLVSYELLYENQTSRERMRVIISSQFLYFFQQSPPDPNSLDNRISLDELAECKPATAKSSIPTVYIVLSLIDKLNSYNAPKYKCFDEKTAKKVAQLINYAKNLHEEEKHVVRTFRLQEGTVLW